VLRFENSPDIESLEVARNVQLHFYFNSGFLASLFPKQASIYFYRPAYTSRTL